MNWPLMKRDEDYKYLCSWLRSKPRLTQSTQVQAFEQEWSEWLGVKYSVFVNSGSSANLITMAALNLPSGSEIIVPALTWVSDIASVIQCGYKPVFVDVDPYTFGMNTDAVIEKIDPRKTKAVFLTHILGFNALSKSLIALTEGLDIPIIEDCCEAHGATFNGKKVGTFGRMSNFSFYYAHHLSTVEGGMVCTDDAKLYQILRMYRSHGMVRECTSEKTRSAYESEFPDLDPNFIFAAPAWNVRNTEIAAVMGRKGLKTLDAEIEVRNHNLEVFLGHLNPSYYRTYLSVDGCSSYALTLVLQKSFDRAPTVETLLHEMGIEYRRGLSGGGNQLRQPYLKQVYHEAHKDYPETEHLHFNSFYIGNYPGIKEEDILELCKRLNEC